MSESFRIFSQLQYSGLGFNNLTDQEILDIASPLMDNLMEDSTQENHQIHAGVLTDQLKAMMST